MFPRSILHMCFLGFIRYNKTFNVGTGNMKIYSPTSIIIHSPAFNKSIILYEVIYITSISISTENKCHNVLNMSILF